MKKYKYVVLIALMLITGCSEKSSPVPMLTEEASATSTIVSEHTDVQQSATSTDTPSKSSSVSIITESTTELSHTDTLSIEGSDDGESPIEVESPIDELFTEEPAYVVFTVEGEATKDEQPEMPVDIEASDDNKHMLPVFTLDNYGRNYALVTIVPEIIYWQDEAHDFTVGEAYGILIPEVIYETISNVDSMIIYLDEHNSFPYKQHDYSFSPITENAQDMEYDNVLANYYWNEEHLLIIDNGILSKIPITDEINEYFDANITDSSLMCMFPNEFYDGMSAQTADEFLKEQRRICSENTDDHEYETIEPSAASGFFMTGTYMRVNLART